MQESPVTIVLVLGFFLGFTALMTLRAEARKPEPTTLRGFLISWGASTGFLLLFFLLLVAVARLFGA